MNRTFEVAALAAALGWATPSLAQQTSEAEPARSCAGGLSPPSVVRCALARSPEVEEARQRLAALAGRRVSAGVWLPSNPVVAATLSYRRRPPDDATATNWSVTLSQELEIAGQRGARLAAVDAEAAAAIRNVTVAEQEVGAAALNALFEAAAAKEGARFAEELAQAGRALAAVAEGRAREALLSGVEADVARAEAARIGLIRLEAERRQAESQAILAITLDRPPGGLDVPDLSALAGPEDDLAGEDALAQRALALRGEVVAAAMERRVLEHRLSLLERERVPNVTVSAFAERGEINDRILGVGLSIPLPLPSPVGHSRAGQIAETLAEIRAAESSLELVRRRVRLQIARALATYRSRQGAVALLAGDLPARARADLAGIREALASRQLPVREAVAWQRSLVDVLQAHLDARVGLAVALVELRRVAGLPLTATGGRR
jgi:cobalt-zinc-cadmium efflux system outer membrane protein